MAGSSENLSSVEPWIFRSAFSDSWISEAFARDSETLTKALQKSLSSSISSDLGVSIHNLDSINSNSAPTPTASNVSGSDPELSTPKRQKKTIPISSGKVAKRKSRASKRSQTTFITADPANFRQMVQQVTGVRVGNAQIAGSPLLKPEPQRPGNRLTGPGWLPTLDTSAVLLDHHHHQQNVGMGAGGSGVGIRPGPLGFESSVVSDGSSAAAGLDFETFASFPTLDSWKVM